MHASLFSPSESTLIQAINNNQLTTWPELTASNIRRHLPKSTATVLGHLDQQRKNLRSTKSPAPQIDDLELNLPITDGLRTNAVYASIVTLPAPTGHTYSDQTGRFPVQSSQGNEYVFVLYDFDSNAIFSEPMRNRTGIEILRCYKKIYELLVSRGLRPQLHKLDNEASTVLKKFLINTGTDYQLAPPHIHRRNAAERAIRTFKNHLIAGLCTVDANFPLHLWDRLLPQACITLNLLRTSRINPKLSAYAQVYGNFDFNRTPLAPPGTKAIIHEKPSQRKSWDKHGQLGWYIGPAMEHYRCYKVYVNKTNAERVGDTVEFFPTSTKLPRLSSADAATMAARDLIKALQKPHPAVPFTNIGDHQLAAIQQLADIFNHAVAPRVAKPTATQRLRRSPRFKTPDTTAQPPRVAASSHKAVATPPAQPSNDIPPQWAPNTPLADLFEQPAFHQMPYYAGSVVDEDTGESLAYEQLINHPKLGERWNTSAANEFGRLAQGIGGRVEGTDTIKFIPKADVPKGHSVTYARFVCQLRPQKAEVERTRLTVGGNLINYPGDTSAPTSDLTTIKCLINSTLSKPKAKMCPVSYTHLTLPTIYSV